MTGASEIWGRVQEEFRAVSDRTRRGAERALRAGVLHVDLVSLRRDRNRAHADLGGRVLALWDHRDLDGLALDPELLRIKALSEAIERSIVAKEKELRLVRTSSPEADPNHP